MGHHHLRRSTRAVLVIPQIAASLIEDEAIVGIAGNRPQHKGIGIQRTGGQAGEDSRGKHQHIALVDHVGVEVDDAVHAGGVGRGDKGERIRAQLALQRVTTFTALQHVIAGVAHDGVAASVADPVDVLDTLQVQLLNVG